MPNFSAKILNNAISGLHAQQAVIATSGNNIANVNTPGYTRRTVTLETRSLREGTTGINVGSGVQIGNITRIADNYLEQLLRDAQAEQQSSQVQNDFLKRVENLFSLTGSRDTIGSTLTGFFTAVNDLTANPSSIELRTNFIQRAQDLVDAIKETYSTVADLQTEADQRIGTELDAVNTLTARIAEMNVKISAREGNENGIAVDERDVRERLLDELAQKVSFSRVELADGSVTITLANGFPLVVGGRNRELEMTIDPSFASGNLPPSLSGRTLGYVVYDYDSSAGAAHIDLTQMLQSGQGSIAGLLGLRGYADPSNTNAFEANGTLCSSCQSC